MMTTNALEPTPHAEPDRTARDRIDPIEMPDRITSSQAKLVYLYLRTRGTTTVDELGTALGLPKLALFSILGTLGEYDLIVRDGDAVSTV
jgi:predicted O-methyltransferase YrrM